MNESPSKRKHLLACAGLTIAAALGVVLWIVFSKGPVVEPVPADKATLISLKNRAIAQLENISNNTKDAEHESTEAASTFDRLARLLPNELIGPRNLAIARVITLERLGPEEADLARIPEVAKQCSLAIKELERREPGSGIPHMLAARVAIKEADIEAAIGHYKMAGKKMPDDYIPWAELFTLLQSGNDLELRRQALQRAYAAKTNNLCLLDHYLRDQAEAEDPAILETLASTRQALRPFASELEQHRINLDEELEEFANRIKADDELAWEDLKFRMLQVYNVVKPGLAYQVDRDQLSRHLLEYMIHDFSDEFYKGLPPIDASATAENPVTLSSVDNQQLAGINDAIDVVLYDYDLDEKLDLVVLRLTAVEVYSFDAGQQSWQLIVGCEIAAGMDHLLVADFDVDRHHTTSAGRDYITDQDLFVYGTGGYQFLENKLGKSPQPHELLKLNSPLSLDPATPIQQALAADIDHDGDLDLVVAAGINISTWINQENWNFTDGSNHALLENDAQARYTSLAAVDWNRNVLIDILVANSATPPGQLENLRHGRFRWQELPDLPEMTEDGNKPAGLGGVLQLIPCDLDGNASWDLIACHGNGISITLTETKPGGSVWTTSSKKLLGDPASGARSWDFDNDGIPDIVAWGSSGVQVFRGIGDGRFAEPFSPTGIPAGEVMACDVGDIDQDGDQDLALVVGVNVLWCINDGGNKNNWIDVRLSAEEAPQSKSQRSNVYGVGSMMELKVGRRYQAQVVSGQVTHFGLGSQQQPDAVRVLWTNGIPQNEVAPKVNLTVTQNQRLLTGSCPYLYTWTGEKYEFFTDLLWAAPIGLLSADGTMVPTRDWEYLLIPGEKLQAHEGEYRMQVTEELWEAAYFDQVELIAVDHPDDISIFSNEKVGPPAVSQFMIHAIPTNKLTPPVAASNSKGEDILSWIDQTDGRYLKLFDYRLKQGLTNEYFMELDLGTLEDPADIRLVMTGWIFPTDTSINVAIFQNPALEPPLPPSIWVPDPAEPDGWKQVVPHMGFPGGKTKTIVVTVPPDQFVDGDYRVRIVSSMELYWDSILVAVDAPTGNFTQTPARLIAADLHERGFSARISGLHNGPDTYDYEDVTTSPAWPPMEGNFTCFGDVTELLVSSDDQLVVLGAGDEMTLRFAQLPPPPAGWKRDFLLHNVGWDKDANLNTVLGHHVDPLPYRGMSQYPPGLSDRPPDSAAYRAYLRKYQTRRFDQRRFWSQLQSSQQ